MLEKLAKQAVKVTLAAGILFGLELCVRDCEPLQRRYVNTFSAYYDWKAHHYLPKAMHVAEEEGVEVEGYYGWGNGNVTFVVGKKGGLLEITKREGNGYSKFTLKDVDGNGTIDNVKIIQVSVGNNTLEVEGHYVDKKQNLLPYQYDYALFMELLSKKKFDEIKKRYPAPKTAPKRINLHKQLPNEQYV